MRQTPLSLALALLGGAIAPAVEADAQVSARDTTLINERYQTLGASCHGRDLEGSQARALVGVKLLHGDDDASIARSIRDGNPGKGMPAWGKTLSAADVRSLVI